MNPYDEVDAVIVEWVKAVGSTLFTEWAGPARFFHLPGDAQYECFQISITPPREGMLSVFARAIDTNDNNDGDFEQSWDGPVQELDAMLSTAVGIVQLWKSRSSLKVQKS